MTNEKVSVIMSTYKEKKEWLRLSIESILKQSYQNLEFLIIIDEPDKSMRIKKTKVWFILSIRDWNWLQENILHGWMRMIFLKVIALKKNFVIYKNTI